MRLFLALLIVTALFAGAKAQSPGGVTPTLTLWLKANVGPEKSPGVPAANGDAITNWVDLSGLGNDYVAVAGPTLQGNALNFNNCVEILSGGFDAPGSAFLGNDWTVFFISKKLASDPDGRVFDGSSADYVWAHWGTFTNSIAINGNPSDFNSGIATATGILNLHLHAYKRESAGGTLEARADGTSLTTFGTSNSGSGIGIDINQGAFSGTEASNSRIGEMIIYSSALTAGEVNQIESYLAVKYGMTITHDYLSSDGTTIWNVTTNAAYLNNITGIGRDDASALDQRKSLSIQPGATVTIDKGGAFGSDKSFILWGNDTGTGASANVSSSFTSRSNRIWKTAVTGSPGAATFSIDLSAIGYPNTGNAADYALLTDANTDFSSGSTTHTAGASLVGSILTFTGVSFNNDEFFTIAATLVSPGGVAGNVFWVRADAGVTAAPDVSVWADQSGLGNDATQAVPANQPSPVPNVLNFNPVVDFSDGSDILALTTPPANQNSTIFTVALPAANSQFRTMFYNSLSDFPLIIEIGGNTLGYFDLSAGSLQSSGFSWAQNEPAVVGLEMRAADVNFRKNGTQGASNATIDLSAKTLDFFGNYQFTNQQFGRVAETIIYNTPSALTTAEKQKIESYLGVKYGITLSHDYLASDATVVWNSTANAAYHNDVAGIGRDDASALDQRKSKSVNTGASVTIDGGGAFGADQSFLLWGNDLGTGTSTNVPASYTLRSNRIWKTAVQGTPGSVTFNIDLTAISLPNSGNAANYALLTDTNTDFSSGSTVHTAGASLVGSILTFTGVTFNNDEFFSVATFIVTPGAVSGAVFWVKADAGVTASPDVSIWADQSGLVNNATQAVAGQQPSLVNGVLNFHPVVDFSGNTDILSITAPPLNLNSTVFAVAIPAVNTQFRTMFRGAVDDHPIIVANGATDLGYFDGDVATFKPGGHTWLENEPALVGLEMRAGDVNFRKNGTQAASIATINLAGLNLDFFGNSQFGFQQFGRIAETIIYNTPGVLTATEKQKVESYLAVKYGITLTHNYLASDAALVWDATANAAYQNNVAGIGRDDATALDQRKSISANPGGAVTMDHGGALATDKNFLLWGDDLGSGTSTNVDPAYTWRSNRIWKTAVTGAPGAVTFSVDLAIINFPVTVPASDFALLTDTNTDFSTGTTAHTAGASLVGSILTFTGVSFNDGEFFAIAAANVPLPGSIAGSVFWVTADVGLVATPDVSNWADQSGSGNSATQPVAGQQPSPVNSVINFHRVVDFTGGTDILSLTTPTPNLNSTIFTVAIPAANTQFRTMFRSINDFPIIIDNGGNTLGYFDLDFGVLKTGGHTWLQNEPAIVGLEMRAADVNFRKNGTQGASITDIDLTGMSLNLFGNSDVTNQQFGRIAETIIYNTASALTSTEKEKVESYLAVKYGITITHNYIASDASVIWNPATNVTYHNNVAGVGRDDDYSLDQRKSIGANAAAMVIVDKGGAFGTDKSYLVWGDDNGALDAFGVTDVPSGEGVLRRIARAWKLGSLGSPGAVTIQFDLSGVLGSKNAADLVLLVDRNKDGFFADETIGGGGVIGGAVNLGSNVFQFTPVTFNDGELMSIGSTSLGTPLPVSLINFQATPGSKSVTVTWSTASETNSDFFTLQKSSDGFEFSDLVQIKAAGTSTSVMNYRYLDIAPFAGYTYYRLRQTDDNGKTSLSHVIAVNLEKNLRIYPNPAANLFIAEEEGIENAQLILTNSVGQKVLFRSTAGTDKLIVDTTDLPRGIYILMISNHGKIMVEKIALE